MASLSPAVVCLGFFDGVHIGHAALLTAARPIAERNGWLVRAHTFDRAPVKSGAELTDAKERVALLRAAGADDVVVSPFDDAMRAMTGEEFFRKIVMDQLRAKHVVCGADHRFGYRGASDVGALKKMCEQSGIGCTVVSDVTLPGNIKVSSTAIRKAIAAGDWALAESMLGRQPTEDMIGRVLNAPKE